MLELKDYVGLCVTIVLASAPSLIAFLMSWSKFKTQVGHLAGAMNKLSDALEKISDTVHASGERIARSEAKIEAIERHVQTCRIYPLSKIGVQQ